MTDKVALITGITGQDGICLAELQLSKSYVVHGVKRRAPFFNTAHVDHLHHDPHGADARFCMHYGDLPDEIYNLVAAYRWYCDSHVAK